MVIKNRTTISTTIWKRRAKVNEVDLIEFQRTPKDFFNLLSTQLQVMGLNILKQSSMIQYHYYMIYYDKRRVFESIL